MTTTTYTICDYTTGSAIGEIYLDDRQYSQYERMVAEGRELYPDMLADGLVRKSDLLTLGAEIVWSDVPATDCVVYLD